MQVLEHAKRINSIWDIIHILRTTTRQQCRGNLRNGEMRCALGVLIEETHGFGPPHTAANKAIVDEFLPKLHKVLRPYHTGIFRIMSLNDRGYTFARIADELEREALV